MLRWLASRRASRAAIVVGLLLSLPALRIGFLMDDVGQRVALGHELAGHHRPPHALYDFTTNDPGETRRSIERGYSPWFTDPRFVIRFFRPLSSSLLALDAALFGNDPLPAHLHSLVWLAIASIFAAAIFRRVLSPTSASVATFVYAFAFSHLVTAGWLAARHSLVSASFAAIAVWAHVKWRSTDWRAGAWIAPFAFVLGLAGGETALGAVVFVALYELIVRRDGASTRALAALPIVVLGLAHLGFYALYGYGARHSGLYISPFSHPVAFLGAAAQRVPILVGELYGGFPSDAATGVDALRAPAVVWGVLSCAAVLLLARPRRQLWWLAVSSILCVLPTVGSVVGGRVLPLALIGSAAVVGTALVESWRRARRQVSLARIGYCAAVVVLAILHLGNPALARIAGAAVFAEGSRGQRRAAEEADLRACPARADAYILTASDPVLSLHPLTNFVFYAPHKTARIGRVRVLSMAAHEQELFVTDSRHFELSVNARARTVTPFELLFRASPLQVGQRFSMPELSATVLAVQSGRPMRVRFERRDDLASVCFLVWQNERVRSFRPRVGERRRIAHELGPMGF